MKNWYIVQSHSSFENKVAGLIKEEAEKAQISDKFDEIIFSILLLLIIVITISRGRRSRSWNGFAPRMQVAMQQ